MITSVHIAEYRGIAQGSLAGLERLNVIVGRNGQGKSSVLEAIYLLCSAPDPTALERVAKRRGWLGPASWRYLGRAAAPSADKELLAAPQVTAELDDDATVSAQGRVERLSSRHLPGTHRLSLTWRDAAGHQWEGSATVDEAGALEILDGGVRWLPGTRFLDVPSMLNPGRVERLLSEAAVGGWLDQVVEHVELLAPGLKDVRLVEIDGHAIAMLYYGGGRPSIPVHLAGDGVHRAVELALAVLGGPVGVLLLEEPENFLHPSARGLCAELMWRAADRGSQIFLSTHSLDLIDDLLASSHDHPERLDRLGVYRTTLDDGTLVARRIGGRDVEDAREILGADLRM